eukprot:TRINITY_DN4257_c0_g1_i3.p1 TRINITY_DN4257_c0_g1~~TRINITY_DN4257_c0_g1_i3.p1  ORF type:complete len:555 (+),score=129.08 TRINITY_DN4257_c0_g1_i3:61-1725(+)
MRQEEETEEATPPRSTLSLRSGNLRDHAGQGARPPEGKSLIQTWLKSLQGQCPHDRFCSGRGGGAMNDAALDLAGKVIDPVYIRNARDALHRVESVVHSLVAQRRLPDDGLTDDVIEHLLHHLALMDSNNYIGNVGVGEREGRVYSSLVKRRHYGMSHGIGRSGDLTANQPKAAGSSLIYSLANFFVLDAIRIAGALKTTDAIVAPSATGMALSLVLQSLPSRPPTPVHADPCAAAAKPAAAMRKRFVIWSRIDQKTCLKCIYTAGYEAKVVPLVRKGDTGFFGTDLDGIRKAVEECGGAANVACVLTTTSCFAPRLPDDVLGVGRICKEFDVPHVVNNAYGIQSKAIMKQLNAAMEHGRVDAFVQSGDKNFMVPVGGSVIATNRPEVLKKVLDIFITLLSMGRNGFKAMLKSREAILPEFHKAAEVIAAARGERVLKHAGNDISFCLTLDTVPNPKQIGSALFNHCVSGPRVVSLKDTKTICGNEFQKYGSHSDDNTSPYLTLACAIGIERQDIDVFVKRLNSEWDKILKRLAKEAKKKAQAKAKEDPAAPSA